MGARILEGAYASAIGGGHGYRRSLEVVRLGLRSGNSGLRSPGLICRGWAADVGRRSLLADVRRSPGVVPRPSWTELCLWKQST